MKKLFIVLMVFCSLILQNCTTQNAYSGKNQISKSAMGAGFGALSGAAVGLLTGDDAKERRNGALIGAVTGSAIGAGAGYYMDRQEAILRQRLANSGVGISRVGDSINLIMPGNITFDTNQSNISSSFFSTLSSVGLVLEEFNKTYVAIEGHTDNVGDASYNAKLSQQRAISVADYLVSQGVASNRIKAVGYGESRPVSSNNTAAGRKENRRVEIKLQPIK